MGAGLKQIRLKGEPIGDGPLMSYECALTDQDGRPVEATAINLRVSAGRPALASVAVYPGEVDVVARVVDLERLEAAEAVCGEAQRALATLVEHFPRDGRYEPGDARSLPRATPGWRAICGLRDVLREWQEQVG